MHSDKSSWNKEATFKELLAAHWEELSQPEKEEICYALEEGLTEKQMRELILLPLEEMAIRVRAYLLEKKSSVS